VVIDVVLALFGAILLLFTWFSFSFKYLLGIYVVLALFDFCLWLFTWFSRSLARFCRYLRDSRSLWKDFVVIYVVLAFFG